MPNALKLITVLLLLDAVRAVNISSPSFSPIVIEAKYEHPYNKTINSTVEYMFLYPASNVTLETARITIESNATHSLPLIIVVRQTTGILSWQIPLLVNSADLDTVIYNKTSRTLCSTKYYRYAQNDDEHVIVGISTASHENITFSINVVEVMDFYLRHVFVLSYKYNSEKKVEVQISPSEPIYYGYIFSKQENSSVIVRVESDNDICMTVSVQNTSCPVFDLERNIEFSGHWQTVSRRGGITVPREAYPLGFFVVLVVKGEDTDCNGLSSSNPLRTKNVTLIVNPTITKRDYVVASVSAAAMVLGFCIIYITAVIVFSIRESKKLATQELINEQDFNEHIPSPSMVEENSPKQLNSTEEDSSLDEDDIDLMEDALSDKDVIRTKVILSVCDLARKEPRILRHKSRLYLYYLTTVAIFYTLPVVQLAVTYQRVLHTTGNQDMCYYNFLCAHPLGLLSDFNHLFSNFGYVMLGLLFIFLTYSREHNEPDKEKIKCYGIPQHYGLFYAMGTALIMEGILSASYHVCPSHSNFQFGMCLLDFIVPSQDTFAIDILQRFKHEARCGIWHLLRPLYPARFIMLVLANLCNVGLAVFGNMSQQGNFATFLLAILMSNLILYTFFYIMMKLCHREKILPTPAIYIFLSMLFWGAALYFFVNKTISWALTPAQSRLYNKPCILLNFFDSHDIWHFLSALAMFFSFMVLLTLDDDLTDVHRSQIPVF
ncbi:SIDT1 protein, partial [Acromyrmex heyeri]